MTTESKSLTNLHELLIEYFSLEELHALCFDLGLDYDELRGEIKSAKARDLITVMLRQNRLADLAAHLIPVLRRSTRLSFAFPRIGENHAKIERTIQWTLEFW